MILNSQLKKKKNRNEVTMVGVPGAVGSNEV